MFKKILVATDLSETSLPALRAALELGRKFNAELTALYVAEPPYQPWFAPLGEQDAAFMERVFGREKTAAEGTLLKQLEAVSAEARQTVRHQVVVRSGSAADAIVQVVKDGGYDAVVMGTHGRRGVQHLMLGSVAERVVRTAPVTVVTVR